ncbi:hypothetical protein JHU04_002837 [Brenneria sp. 4F2]|nr:hypothetical protein [Brenneria bubanii]
MNLNINLFLLMTPPAHEETNVGAKPQGESSGFLMERISLLPAARRVGQSLVRQSSTSRLREGYFFITNIKVRCSGFEPELTGYQVFDA